MSGEQIQAEVTKILEGLGHLTEDQRQELAGVLRRHPTTLFATRPGSAADTVMDIDARGPPVRRRPRRYSGPERAEMERQVKYLREQGFVEPSTSEWCAGVVLAPKKDGSLRFCVDYRELNDRTAFDAYPMPNAESALDALTGACFFTTIDAEKGYHQVPLHPAARKFTAFATHEGLWQYTRIKNAPACFQRMMDLLLAGMLWRDVLAYIDDVIIFHAPGTSTW